MIVGSCWVPARTAATQERALVYRAAGSGTNRDLRTVRSADRRFFRPARLPSLATASFAAPATAYRQSKEIVFQGDRVMSRIFLRGAFAAALCLSVLSVAAPMALADSPGYLFRDFGPQSSISV